MATPHAERFSSAAEGRWSMGGAGGVGGAGGCTLTSPNAFSGNSDKRQATQWHFCIQWKKLKIL